MKRAKRWMRLMTGAVWWWMLCVVSLGIMMFSPRARYEMSDIGFGISALWIFALIMLVFTLFLHWVALPRLFEYYLSQNDIFRLKSLLDYSRNEQDEELLRAACVFTKKRNWFSFVFLVLCVVALVASLFWPLETVPKKLPTEFYYSEDGKKLMNEEFGTMAYLTEGKTGEEELWVCSSVQAYGPFEYGDELSETLLSRMVFDDVMDAETNQYLFAHYTREWLLVKVVNYEDGDWLFVKRFISGENRFPLEGKRALEVLDEILEADLEMYKIHWLPKDEMQLSTLEAATDGILTWENTDNGIIFLKEGYDE